MNAIFSDMLAISEQLKAKGPLAHEIWFIDRDAEYELFLHNMREVPAGKSSNIALDVRLFRAHVKEFFDATYEQRLGMKIFRFCPGIWVVMSDGTVLDGSKATNP